MELATMYNIEIGTKLKVVSNPLEDSTSHFYDNLVTASNYGNILSNYTYIDSYFKVIAINDGYIRVHLYINGEPYNEVEYRGYVGLGSKWDFELYESNPYDIQSILINLNKLEKMYEKRR